MPYIIGNANVDPNIKAVLWAGAENKAAWTIALPAFIANPPIANSRIIVYSLMLAGDFPFADKT